MTKENFEILGSVEKEPEQVITAEELVALGCDNKTLLYGYTCRRETLHTYIKNGVIHVVIYQNEYDESRRPHPINMREVTVISNRDYVADKRLYPERCDFEFCKRLTEKGIRLPFTVWNEKVNLANAYFGFTLEDVEASNDSRD